MQSKKHDKAATLRGFVVYGCCLKLDEWPRWIYQNAEDA